MSHGSTQALDQALAVELSLSLSPFALRLHQLTQLTPHRAGLVFVRTVKGVSYFDVCPHYHTTQGIRHKRDRFLIPQRVLDHLKHKRYQRWYVFSDGQLFVLHKHKYADLADALQWTMVDDAQHTTRCLSDVEDTMGLRSKPLKAMRARPVTWADCQPPIEQRSQYKLTPAAMGLI